MIEPPPEKPATPDIGPESSMVSDLTDIPVAQAHSEYVATLFERYRASLHRYLARLMRTDDVGELVQEAYFRLLRHGGTVRLDAMARSFLFHTATNLARDHRRRSLTHRTQQHVPIDDEEIAEDHLGPEQRLVAEQTLASLERAIADLPADTRTVFLLHRFRELSYVQIGKIMNLSTRSVARKMADALERLTPIAKAAL